MHAIHYPYLSFSLTRLAECRDEERDINCGKIPIRFFGRNSIFALEINIIGRVAQLDRAPAF